MNYSVKFVSVGFSESSQCVTVSDNTLDHYALWSIHYIFVQNTPVLVNLLNSSL